MCTEMLKTLEAIAQMLTLLATQTEGVNRQDYLRLLESVNERLSSLKEYEARPVIDEDELIEFV